VIQGRAGVCVCRLMCASGGAGSNEIHKLLTTLRLCVLNVHTSMTTVMLAMMLLRLNLTLLSLLLLHIHFIQCNHDMFTICLASHTSIT
jgi:hypothetical protein